MSFRVQYEKVRNSRFGSPINRARPGIEPGTSRTRSENHTPRPTCHDNLKLFSFIIKKSYEFFVKFLQHCPVGFTVCNMADMLG